MLQFLMPDVITPFRKKLFLQVFIVMMVEGDNTVNEASIHKSSFFYYNGRTIC